MSVAQAGGNSCQESAIAKATGGLVFSGPGLLDVLVVHVSNYVCSARALARASWSTLWAHMRMHGIADWRAIYAQCVLE